MRESVVSSSSIPEENMFSQEFGSGKKTFSSALDTSTKIMSLYSKLDNYPWGNNPISVFKSYGITGLGKIQRELITYIDTNFFKYNTPMFLKQEKLGKAIGYPNSQAIVSRGITSLAKRGIVFTIRITKPDGSLRLLVLPSIGYKISDLKLSKKDMEIHKEIKLFFKKIQDENHIS